MSRNWETRTDGRLCLVIDPEDGTHAQRVYGKDEHEILEKVANTVEHSARHIAALKAQTPTRPIPAQGPPPTAPRKPLTSEELMTRTADLQSPGKAPAAVRELLDEATGGAVTRLQENDLAQRRKEAIDRFALVAAGWVQKHPEFPGHPANKKMLADAAALRVGLEHVTEDVLQAVFLDLLEGGHLVQDPENETPPTVQPGETPAPRTVRTQATTYRPNSLRAAPPAPATPKPRYTREQINSMTSDDLKEKFETEAGFADLVAQYAATR